eukprot:TRINITY_DN5197_c0_g1_i2.p1 TRINITY_DN5197_c0_g1~~TRINITY_DN5197_c0_g1_i2.p1  ORF type:complete len:329 (+),score=-0.06 TRINITY_DN5197_c0_g1_i2:188-1174(+)
MGAGGTKPDPELFPQVGTSRVPSRTPRKTPERASSQRVVAPSKSTSSLPAIASASKRSGGQQEPAEPHGGKRTPAAVPLTQQQQSSAVLERTRSGRPLSTPRQITPRTPPKSSSSNSKPQLRPLGAQKSASDIMSKEDLLLLYSKEKLRPMEFTKVHPEGMALPKWTSASTREFSDHEAAQSPELPVLQEVSAGPSVPRLVLGSLASSGNSEYDAIHGSTMKDPDDSPEVTHTRATVQAKKGSLVSGTVTAPAGHHQFASSHVTASSDPKEKASSGPQAYQRGSVSAAVRLLVSCFLNSNFDVFRFPLFSCPVPKTFCSRGKFCSSNT